MTPITKRFHESTFVPIEIIEEILEQLYYSDPLLNDPEVRASLVAASTTCQALRPFCQKFLFSKVDICADDSEPGISGHPPQTRFLDLILDKPHIATYVQSLSFNREGYHAETTTVQNPDLVSLSIDTVVARILRLLPRLQSLQLEETNFLSWDKMGDDLKSVLYAVVRRPEVYELKLSFIRFIPFSFLFPLPNIKKLCLIYCHLDTDMVSFDSSVVIDEENSLQHRPALLKKLCVPRVGPDHAFSLLFLGPQPAFDLSRLEVLEGFPHDQWEYILQRCSSTLRELYLMIYENQHLPTYTSACARLPALKSLSLYLLPSPPPDLSGLLNGLAAPRMLEYLTIVVPILDLYRDYPPGTVSVWMSNLEASLISFTDLRRVQVRAIMSTKPEGEEEQILNNFTKETQRALPGMQARGVLEVNHVYSDTL